MKKFLAKFGLLFILINLALTLNMEIAGAAPTTTPTRAILSPSDMLKLVGEAVKNPGSADPIIKDFVSSGQHPDAPGDIEPGIGAVTSPIFFAIDLFRYAVSGIAFIIIIIAAIKLVSTSTDEEAAKAKNTLLVGIVGLLIIQLADPLVKKMFFGEQGEAFEDVATAQLYAEETVSYIRGIVGFLHLFLGAIAVLVIVIRGFTLVVSGGEEEAMTKAKKHIMYAVVGLAIVGLSEVVVRGFIFPESGTQLPDVGVGRTIIVSITNYLAGFVAILSFIMLFFSGYRYVVAGGEEEVTEKVKKTVLGAVIGLVLSLAAFAIVNTFVKIGEQPLPGTPSEISEPAQP